MKKLLLLISITLITSACASFNPIQINYVNAVEHPKAVSSDSIFVYARMIGDIETGTIKTPNKFKQDDEVINAAMICISNRSNKKLGVRIYSSDKITLLNDVSVYDHYSFSPTAHFIIWSIPWIANIAAGLPIHYGLLFPIIGLVELTKAGDVNNRVQTFVEQNKLGNQLPGLKSLDGLIYLRGSVKDLLFEFTHKGELFTTIKYEIE
ncbi:MAG: hypothetical protein AB1394_07890 [Bacteroidota bacterium]